MRAAPSRSGPGWLRAIGGVVDATSYRRQIIVSTVALGLLVAGALIAVAQFVLGGNAISSIDRVLHERAVSVVSAVDSATTSTRLVVPSAEENPGVVVYDTGGDLVAGFVPPPQRHFFEELATTDRERTVQLGSAFVLLGRPFKTKSGASGVVVIAERLDPYQEDNRNALIVSIIAGVVIVLAAAVVAALASRRALAPVAQMAQTATDWSERDLESRFDLGPPTNEIRALGRTLDGLLDRVARAILTEQRLTSELAHELRTPLTAIQGTAELMAMREDLDGQLREDLADILASCRVMTATIASLLDLARSQSTARAREVCSVRSALEEACQDLDKDGVVTIDVGAEVQVAVPQRLVVRIVAPVLDNAVREAQHVEVSTEVSQQLVHLLVSDDGPGVPADAVDDIFTAGHTTGEGSGLGLALARRIARSVGGDVTLAQTGSTSGHPRRGATFAIVLPAANGD